MITMIKGGPQGDLLALNGAELDVADFPDLFDFFGYAHGGDGSKFSLPDTSIYLPPGTFDHLSCWRRRSPSDKGEWFITPYARRSFIRSATRISRNQRASLEFWSTEDGSLGFWRMRWGWVLDTGRIKFADDPPNVAAAASQGETAAPHCAHAPAPEAPPTA